MGVDAAAAAVVVMVFEGTCYVTPLLGAYLADSHWGRYATILVFSAIYLLGMVGLAATAALPGLTPGPTETANGLQTAVLCAALGVIALGTGGIKPNVSAFGADQFDERDPQDKREKESFFNWFYLAINVGCVVRLAL
jgi:dipeptide/tripeptide permease